MSAAIERWALQRRERPGCQVAGLGDRDADPALPDVEAKDDRHGASSDGDGDGPVPGDSITTGAGDRDVHAGVDRWGRC